MSDIQQYKVLCNASMQHVRTESLELFICKFCVTNLTKHVKLSRQMFIIDKNYVTLKSNVHRSAPITKIEHDMNSDVHLSVGGVEISPLRVFR